MIVVPLVGRVQSHVKRCKSSPCLRINMETCMVPAMDSPLDLNSLSRSGVPRDCPLTWLAWLMFDCWPTGDQPTSRLLLASPRSQRFVLVDARNPAWFVLNCSSDARKCSCLKACHSGQYWWAIGSNKWNAMQVLQQDCKRKLLTIIKIRTWTYRSDALTAFRG